MFFGDGFLILYSSLGVNISAYLHDLILYQYLYQIALHDLFTTLFCRLFVNGFLSASTIDLVLFMSSCLIKSLSRSYLQLLNIIVQSFLGNL